MPSQNKRSFLKFISENPRVTETTWAWFGDNIKELKFLLNAKIVDDIERYCDRPDFKVYKVKILKGV